MFDIEYKGGNSVVINTKKAKLVLDPKLSLVGLKDLDTKNAVAVATEERFATNNSDALLNIESPGEYEVSDFSLKGIPAQRHLDTPNDPKLSTIYRLEIGDARIALIGNVDANLSDDQLEAIGLVDIVVIPVGGGGYTLDATSASQMIRKIEAKVIIPVHYADEKLQYEVPQDMLETFTKEFGGQVEETPKYKVKSVSTLPVVTTIVAISRS